MICSFNVIRVLSCHKYISLRLFEELFFLFYLRYGWSVGIVQLYYLMISSLLLQLQI